MLIASSLYISRRLFRQVCMLYATSLAYFVTCVNFYCRGHYWSVSQMSRLCVCFLQHLNLSYGELCQAYLTQGQVAQCRFIVKSGV